MSILQIKGVNDIKTVAEFSKSANELGLLGQDKKLQTFVDTAGKAGLLAPGKMSMEDVANTVGRLQTQGVLPTGLQQPGQVLNLLYTIRNLGLNSGNFTEKIAAINSLTRKFGLAGGSKDANASPAHAGRAINWHQLHFAPFEFKDILALDITQAVNEHARLTISGTLPENISRQAQDEVQNTTQSTPVALHYVTAKGEVKCFFKGVVTNIRQRSMGELRLLDIEAVSYSYLLDIKKFSSSYQRHQEPYRYVFERINSRASKYISGLTGDVVAARASEAGKQTGRIIIQHLETDHEFLKRLASDFNLGLIPDITFDSPKIYFGPPEFPQSGENEKEQQGPELNAAEYQIRRDTGGYAVSTNNRRQNSGITFTENDFTCVTARSYDILRLGQNITFLNQPWYIKAIHSRMEGGYINNIYTLVTQKGLMQDDLYNNHFPGISLQGVVKEVKNDIIKAHITEIDETWDDGTTWWFPYTTIYSSPDGSGYYFMPEVNDHVRIYFPNNKEAESVAVSSINLPPGKRGNRENPDHKVISNVHGKQVVITPDSISIISNPNQFMTLTDAGGLTVKTDKKIIFDAKDDILITSKQKLTIAGKEINLVQENNSINIDSEKIQLAGFQVKMQP